MNISYRTALLLGIVGLALIFVGEQLYSVPDVRPEAISDRFLGDRITTDGAVKDLHVNEDITFITPVSAPDNSIVTFTKPENVRVNDTITVHGRVKLYHGELEVVADRIRV